MLRDRIGFDGCGDANGCNGVYSVVGAGGRRVVGAGGRQSVSDGGGQRVIRAGGQSVSGCGQSASGCGQNLNGSVSHDCLRRYSTEQACTL